MKRRIERIALGTMEPINPYGTVILGMFTLLWGLWIVNPFWNVFSHANLYSQAEAFAPEWAWGTWSTVAGLFVIWGVTKGHYRTWVFSLGFLVWHWWTIAGFLWWGDWENTGGLTYTFIAIYSTYAWLNMKINEDYFNPPHLT